jgi:hypothetical protein
VLQKGSNLPTAALHHGLATMLVVPLEKITRHTAQLAGPFYLADIARLTRQENQGIVHQSASLTP